MKWVNTHHGTISIKVRTSRLVRFLKDFQPKEGRYEDLVEKFKRGGEMDMPSLYISTLGMRLTFEDGRHRTLVSYEQGLETIEIAVPPERSEIIAKIIE